MKRSLFGAVALAAVALSVVLIGAASAAKPPPAPTNNTCPTNAKNLPTSSIVSASVSSVGPTSTYTFYSLTDPAQTSQGTPGLVNYCVYTVANPGPTAVTVAPGLAGADGSLWTASKPGKNFGFSRPGGEKTNIELNGQTVTMGTATWAANAPAPTAQTLVLHISSAAECGRLGIASATCFVLPGTVPTGTLTVQKVVVNDNGQTKIATDFKFKVNGGTATSFIQDGDTLHGKNTVTVPSGAYSVVEDGTPITGYGTTLSAGCSGTMPGGGSATCTITNDDSPPVCDAGKGSSDFAYNAMPFDIYNGCPPRASFSFEGNLPTKEFGDEVQLAGTGTLIKTMTVSFDSFGCGTSGHWYDVNGDCTTGSETFLIPASGTDPAGIRANLYDGTGDTVGALLGTATNTGPFPFRPSADNVKCVNPGTDANSGDDRGKWYDAAANLCLNGLAFPVSFDFSSQNIAVPAGGKVIWTVIYNTSNSGTTPLGNLTTCRVTGDPGCGYDSLNVDTWTYANAPYAGTDSFPDLVFWDKGLGGGLATDSGWTGFTPLAQITIG
jgi:hypothetical protein